MDQWWKNLSSKQRLLWKWAALLVGVIVLGAMLLSSREVVRILTKGELDGEEEKVPPAPVYRDLYNVWVLSDDGKYVTVFSDGIEEQFEKGRSVSGLIEGNKSECLADLHLTDGVITELRYKTERVSGRVLGVTDSQIEIEGKGNIPLRANYRGYRLFGSLQPISVADIPIGAANTDFVLEEGEICGFLLVREEAMDDIRVLIHTSHYESKYHQELTVTADTDFQVVFGTYPDRQTEDFAAGEEVTFLPGCGFLRQERAQIIPRALTGRVVLKNVERSNGTLSYAGELELVDCEEGIAVINVLPLEEYLLSVVPSEMPAGFPAEALKAQAICARTYAYSRMQRAAYTRLGAHVDDSVSFQVYNNIAPQASTTEAVRATYGKLLLTEAGEPAETFYYSTSCGLGSDATVWKTAAAEKLTYLAAREIRPEGKFLESVPTEEELREFLSTPHAGDYEQEEPYYRWNIEVAKLDAELLLKRLKEKKRSAPQLILTGTEELEDFSTEQAPDKLGEIVRLEIRKRGAGGVAEELLIEGKLGAYLVLSENAIRYVLCDGKTPVVLQNGKERDCPTLLPSGFFTMDTISKGEYIIGYKLTGGGFGHGAGMSQNAAKHMAQDGMTAEEILDFFYPRCVVR